MDDPLAKDPTGIIVGNPCIDDAIQSPNGDLASLVDEAYKFGFMAPDLYRTLTSDECRDAVDAFEPMLMDDDDDDDDDGQMDDDQQQQDQEMRKKTRASTRFPPNNRKLFQMLHKNEVGIGTRLPPRNHNKLQRMLRKAEQTKQKETRGIGFTQTDHVVKQCLSAFYESSFSSASYFSYGIDVYGVFNPWVGAEVGDASPLAKYLSQDNVQTALHVNVADVTTFSMCSDMVSYTKQYAACGVSDPEFPDISMINFYQEIAPKLKKTWIFSGDTDAVVPMEVSLWHASFDYRLFFRAFSLTFSVLHLCLPLLDFALR